MKATTFRAKARVKDSIRNKIIVLRVGKVRFAKGFDEVFHEAAVLVGVEEVVVAGRVGVDGDCLELVRQCGVI